MTLTERVKDFGKRISEARLAFRRAKYGQISVSVGSWMRQKGKEWKVPTDRLAIYDKAWSYFLENQFARPIINLVASATFGKGIQFIGDNKQVTFARKLFDGLDLFQIGIESGIYGDDFIRLFTEDEQGNHTDEVKLGILPPKTINKYVAEGNVLEVEKYMQFEGTKDEEVIEPAKMVHIMMNSVSDSLYGNSDLLHLFYHFDMYDSLLEEADKRRLFASQPVGKFTGVDMRYRSTLKDSLGKVSRDVDQKKGLRRSIPPGSNLLLPTGMDFEFVEPSGKFDLESMLNRVAKIIAMASETPLHWLNLSEEIALKTARESEWPFIQKIHRRQAIFMRSFEELLLKVKESLGDNFPYDSENNKERKFDLRVAFPPIFDYELAEIQQMTIAIMGAFSAGIISKKTALDLICNYFGLDVEKEEERLKGEEEKEDKKEFGQVEKTVGEIGRAVAKGEIEKETATRLINKILEKG